MLLIISLISVGIRFRLIYYSPFVTHLLFSLKVTHLHNSCHYFVFPSTLLLDISLYFSPHHLSLPYYSILSHPLLGPFCCCSLPTPMTLASGGTPIFPFVVHQPASPSIWSAVKSCRRDLSTHPGVTMWCVCGCS